jgi:D-alanyl-D-alanine carboxypeptidase
MHNQEPLNIEIRKPSASQKVVFVPGSAHAGPPKNRSWKRFFLHALIFFTLTGVAFGAGALVVLKFSPQTAASPSVHVVTENGVLNIEYGEQPLLSQPDFFEDTRQSFLRDKVTFIEANLSTMELTYYDQGIAVFTAKILTKGKEGSWWETPAGLYKIETKEENHFSTFGEVYQPWSMAFQGNFFIHGWPYYPGGEAVSSTFSGGCIRLSNEDAEALFKQVAVGTPILVFESDFQSDGYTYEATPPPVSASAFLVADLESKTVLASKNHEAAFPIASITKLVTALVAAEYINLDKDIYITEGMLASTTVPRLSAGTTESAYGLLFPLLLESSNEAAEAFARHLGRDWFISLMNKKADSLGMFQSEFADPAGFDSGNVASPQDLLHLLQYLYNNRSFILRISSGRDVVSAYTPVRFSGLQNFNNTTKEENFIGGKVGETLASKQTDVSLFEVVVEGKKRVIAMVLLGSEDRNADMEVLKAHVYERYGIEI